MSFILFRDVSAQIEWYIYESDTINYVVWW